MDSIWLALVFTGLVVLGGAAIVVRKSHIAKLRNPMRAIS